MQVLITHGTLARSRVLHFQRWQLLGAAVAVLLGLLLTSGAIYHYVFLKGAREGWPVVSQLVHFLMRDETAQRDRIMRDNLDAMAQKVGEMQAKLVRLEAMGERVSGLVGVKSEELKPLQRRDGSAAAGKGGPYVPATNPSLEQLQSLVGELDEAADINTDLFTYLESRLQENRLTALMVPSAAPVDVAVGSGFGFRTDPFNGRPALHSGLDFPAEVGTPITAAAGGIVIAREWNAGYGNMLEIDHGNGLVTRYAHCSQILVEVGAVVRRGQLVAKVGNTGRSTGPHLHLEVLLGGVPQNPSRFLARAGELPRTEFAARPGSR